MSKRTLLTLLTTFAAFATPASANVITEWDEIAVKIVQPAGQVPPIPFGLTFRAMAMVHIAMFDAVNAIEPSYRVYKLTVEPSPGASQDAAAAFAVGPWLEGRAALWRQNGPEVLRAVKQMLRNPRIPVPRVKRRF